MPFRQVGALRVFQFESLNHPGLLHAVFTRGGGVSPEPWRSLNLGGTVGDARDRVQQNRQRALEAIGRTAESLYEIWQVHSAHALRVDQPRGAAPLVQADILVTDAPQVTLLMRFADCLPILLFDPARGAVGLAHAGWLGTVRKAAAAAVRAMRQAFGSRPRDLLVGIGPSIGPDHYAVGQDVVAMLHDSFGARAEQHLRRNNGSIHLDLWSANRQLLEEEGVEAIEVAGLCTACHLEDWYSHRGEHGRTGRFGALIAVNG
jgi:YfiH family protein